MSGSVGEVHPVGTLITKVSRKRRIRRRIKRYSLIGKVFRWLLRWVHPVPVTPYIGKDVDICSVKLVPEKALIACFREVIRKLPTTVRPAYLEFGVYNGSSLLCMIEACRLEGRDDFKFIGLDSFKGLPPKVVCDDGGIWKVGQFSCSLNEALSCLSRRGASAENITLEECWYDELEPSRLKALLGEHRPSIVMIDCDAYSSAVSAIALLDTVSPDEYIIFFDDWKLHDVDLSEGGEYRAFHEWLDKRDNVEAIRINSYSRKAEGFLIKSR